MLAMYFVHKVIYAKNRLFGNLGFAGIGLGILIFAPTGTSAGFATTLGFIGILLTIGAVINGIIDLLTKPRG